MKKLSVFRFKFAFVALLLTAVSFSFLGFNDSGEYTIKDNIIIRGPGRMYQVGVINIKFKNDAGSFSSKSFGIQPLDRILNDIETSEINQLHPLNPNPLQRHIGDEQLARIFEIKYNSTEDPFDAASKVLNDNSGIIEWAEPSFVYEPDYIPNDPQISAQYHISRINCYQGWDISKGDTSIIIGIVDSGSDLDHPDLHTNYKYNWADPINNVDDDLNGYIDDFMGWDFADNDNNPNCDITANDHGSHVSGCATQVADNGIHGAGPGFKVKFRATKHNNSSGQGLYYTDAGIVYQYQMNAKVINCSFGSYYYSAYSQLVINNAWSNGTVTCASAGNEGINTVRYPASYDNVVSVAATTSSDTKASFSNYHTTVDVCAPGQGILSTVWKNSYAIFDGTSMSAPVTSGTVGLIWSKHPTWTPQQVVERLQIGVDSIYNLNPSYVGLLGTGRVNAFKCLADYPILRITSFVHNDSIYGNNDKVYDVDEVIPVQLNLKNSHLAGTNVSIRLTTASPYVTIVQDSVYIGNVPAYGTVSTSFANTFKVKANSSCPFDADVAFKVEGSSTAYTENTANTFTIRFRQGYAVHNVNNLILALTGDGAVGKKTQPYGSGLQIGSGTTNNIYEGSFMVGISDTKVSDVGRRGSVPANISDTDFVAMTTYTMTKPGTLSAQDGQGKFNDNGAGTNKLGVEVQAYSYAFTTSGDQDYILLKYRIKNTNASALNNVYAGIYMWYAPDGYFSTNNISRLSSTNRLAYMYNTTVANRYLGVGLMTNQNLNFKLFTSSEIFNGFTTAEKWSGLSGGVVNDSLGPGGNAFVIGLGPFNLAPNAVETVGFAVVRGDNLGDIIAKNNTAKMKFQSVGIKTISEEIPTVYSLSQNYPNPFNPVTNIRFGIPKNDFVRISVFDILGREVSVLVNEFKKAGFYEVNFNAASLSSGTYFYRIQSGSFADIKKMVVLK